MQDMEKTWKRPASESVTDVSNVYFFSTIFYHWVYILYFYFIPLAGVADVKGEDAKDLPQCVTETLLGKDLAVPGSTFKMWFHTDSRTIGELG